MYHLRGGPNICIHLQLAIRWHMRLIMCGISHREEGEKPEDEALNALCQSTSQPSSMIISSFHKQLK